jgi:hypothetical protein
MKVKPFSSFDMAQEQFESVAELLGLEEGMKELLRRPLREYSFSLPTRMDDGKFKVFRGFRVHHNPWGGARAAWSAIRTISAMASRSGSAGRSSGRWGGTWDLLWMFRPRTS